MCVQGMVTVRCGKDKVAPCVKDKMDVCVKGKVAIL